MCINSWGAYGHCVNSPLWMSEVSGIEIKFMNFIPNIPEDLIGKLSVRQLGVNLSSKNTHTHTQFK